MSLSKNELITKLETIAKLYNITTALQNKMDRFQPVDKYARQIAVPSFPGNYKSEQEREAWKKAIPHEKADAVEIAAATHRKYLYPKEPEKPVIRGFQEPPHSSENDNQEKYGCLSKVGLGVAIFFFLGIFFGDVVEHGALPVTLAFIAVGIGAFFFFKKKLDRSKAITNQEYATALEKYNQDKNKQLADYTAAVDAYNKACAAYETTSRTFLQEYSAWRPIYLKHLQEEAVITQQLEADRKAEVNRIYAEEYAPAEKALTEYNDLVAGEYLPVIDTIIDLLKSGRADNLKEAINLYENIVYREQQLKLEREKEEHRQQEAAEALEAEERRHRAEIARQEEQEWQRQFDERARQRREAEEKKEWEAKERKAAAKAKEEAERKCRWCKNWSGCGMKRNPPLNCTGFRPGSTYQI